MMMAFFNGKDIFYLKYFLDINDKYHFRNNKGLDNTNYNKLMNVFYYLNLSIIL